MIDIKIDPKTTAADLRNAGMVAAHLGHLRESYLNPSTARVCADGALRLATYEKLSGTAREAFLNDHVVGEYGSPELRQQSYTLSARYRVAVAVLIPMLPERCDDPLHRDRDGYPTCQASQDGTLPDIARIHHFNDYVCRGGEDVELLFAQAAEKVEANECG